MASCAKPVPPRNLFVFVRGSCTTLSDTKDGLVRSSCQESRRPAPSFEFALQSIKSMKGTNQRRDEQPGGTLDLTYIGEVTTAWGTRLWESDIMWPFSGTTDPLIRMEAVWIPTCCLMWIIKSFQHELLSFDVIFFFFSLPALWRESRISLLATNPSPKKASYICFMLNY